MAEAGVKPTHGAGPEPAPAPGDEENPAIIDAHRTFIVTVVGAAAFIGAVISFIL